MIRSISRVKYHQPTWLQLTYFDWRWLPHRLSTKILFRTALTRPFPPSYEVGWSLHSFRLTLVLSSCKIGVFVCFFFFCHDSIFCHSSLCFHSFAYFSMFFCLFPTYIYEKFATEPIRKLNNFSFQWTKTLYHNILNNTAFFFTLSKATEWYN